MVLSLILTGLSACETNIAALNGVCQSDLGKPIIIYGQNDPRTEAGVDRHNAAYACACEQDCPQP